MKLRPEAGELSATRILLVVANGHVELTNLPNRVLKLQSIRFN